MQGQEHVVASDVGKAFDAQGGTLIALSGVDLTVRQGEFLSIVGPSGCGKTTLLRILGGLLEPTEGSVSIGGADPKDAQERREIGFVFQEASLLPWRTVEANVRLPLEAGAGTSQGRTVAATVEAVGLRDFARYYPHQLSGGMRQRVALARALVFQPSLLLMDEPLGSLDEITRSAMRYELLRLWEAENKTVVMVTHSVPEAAAMSDRVVVMAGNPGRVRATVTIALPRPRHESMERGGRFLDYVDEIRAHLR